MCLTVEVEFEKPKGKKRGHKERKVCVCVCTVGRSTFFHLSISVLTEMEQDIPSKYSRTHTFLIPADVIESEVTAYTPANTKTKKKRNKKSLGFFRERVTIMFCLTVLHYSPLLLLLLFFSAAAVVLLPLSIFSHPPSSFALPSPV